MSRKDMSPAMRTLNDLDNYRAWCVDFGFNFYPRDLYRQDSPWSLYQRWRHGDKTIRNNWERDAERLGNINI